MHNRPTSLQEIITAINFEAEFAVTQFIIKNRIQNNDKTALTKLVLALKQLANPHGAYFLQNDFGDTIAQSAYFKTINAVLNGKKQLIQGDEYLPLQEKTLAMLRFKLDKIADILEKEFKLSISVDLSKQVLKQENWKHDPSRAWWRHPKVEPKREGIIGQYALLSIAALKEIKQRSKKDVGANVRNYYYLANHESALFGKNLAEKNQLRDISLYAVPGLQKNELSGLDIAELSILGFYTGILPGIFAAKKLYKSWNNFYNDYKSFRSFTNLFGITSGGLTGVGAGMAIGGILGSAAPGIGTVIGMAVGGVIGGLWGAGLGAFVFKYGAKLISAINHPDALNPSNPEKYELSKDQKLNLLNKRLNENTINQMLLAAQAEKSELGILSFIPFTNAYRTRKHWNVLISMIKDGKIDHPFQIGGKSFDPRIDRKDDEPDDVKQDGATPEQTNPTSSSAMVLQQAAQNGATLEPILSSQTELPSEANVNNTTVEAKPIHPTRLVWDASTSTYILPKPTSGNIGNPPSPSSPRAP